VLSIRDGRLDAEILPTPTPELLQSVRETREEFKDAFDDLKRLGE